MNQRYWAVLLDLPYHRRSVAVPRRLTFNFYLWHFIKYFSLFYWGGGHLCFIVVSGSRRSSDGLSGVLSVQRHTERTCALTLTGLSFTMMLSHEFNYLGLHINAFYLAATLRSQSWKLNHTKDRLLHKDTKTSFHYQLLEVYTFT